MFIDPASTPLCHNNNDKTCVKNNDNELHSSVDTITLPMRHYLDENTHTYNRKNESITKKKRKFLCIILIIIVFLIVVIGMILWIIYKSNIKPPEYDNKYTTSQPLNTEYSSNLYQTTEIDISQMVKKVLFIVADGIPADVIENSSVINMKHIEEIGGYTRAFVGGEKGTYSETATISSPGYMSLLTGTWGNKHNVYNNYVKSPNYNYKNIFRLIKEEQPKKKIGIFSTWTTNRIKLIGEGLFEAGNITFDYKFDGYELDEISYPHDKKSIYIYNIDKRVTNETSKCIREYAPDLSWVYLQYTDDIGHFFGDSQQFSQSIIYLDEQIGEIWNAIDYRIKYYKENWLFIITTDHGRDSKKGKHHAGQSIRERTIWILTNSKETNNYFHNYQPAIVDIYPTIAKFIDLNIPIDYQRELDGISLIGNISIIKPYVNLNDDKLNISWTVIQNTGFVKIWISTSNLFKKGINDNYQLIDTVSIDKKMVIIDIKQYPSQFYKIVLEGKYNMVNKWVYRKSPRNKT